MPRQSGPIRILAIDGGGLKDIIPLEVLKRLEAKTGQKIHDMFDMVCGTSGGGLIAISVGITNTSLDEVTTAFDDMTTKIFGGIHGKIAVQATEFLSTGSAVPVEPLRKKIIEFIKNSNTIDCSGKNPEDIPIYQGNNAIPKVFLVTTDKDFKPYLLRNYAHDNEHFTILEATLASAAPSFFFKPVIIDGATDKPFIDGGLSHAANPVLFAITEANKLRAQGGPWEGRELGCLVSIGTGEVIKDDTPPSTSSKFFGKVFPGVKEILRVLGGGADEVLSNDDDTNNFVKLLQEWESKFYYLQVPIPERYSTGFMARDVEPLKKLLNDEFDGKSVQKIVNQGGVGCESIAQVLDRLVATIKAQDGNTQPSPSLQASALFTAGCALYASFRPFQDKAQPTSAHGRFSHLLNLLRLEYSSEYQDKIADEFFNSSVESPNPHLPSFLEPLFSKVEHSDLAYAAFKLGFNLHRLVALHLADLTPTEPPHFNIWWKDARPFPEASIGDREQRLGKLIEYLFSSNSKFWTGYWLLENIAANGGTFFAEASKVAVGMVEARLDDDFGIMGVIDESLLDPQAANWGGRAVGSLSKL